MKKQKKIRPVEHPINVKLVKHRNEIAALQSIIPGLGHIYKGYVAMGLSLMVLFPIFVYAGIVMALATVGLGLVIPIGYITFAAWHAYIVEDHRKHHIWWF